LTLFGVRLVTGMVVGVFALMHFGNHALGLISAELQEQARPWVMFVWNTTVGQAILHGSLTMHATLGLYALVKRRHLRIPASEAVQLGLGLLIPVLLLGHIASTRGTRALAGIDITYTYEIAHLWLQPWRALQQVLLLVLVWSHLVVGLHTAFSFRAFYRRMRPLFVVLFVAVPLLAIGGFVRVGHPMTARAAREPGWFPALKAQGVPSDPAKARTRDWMREHSGTTWLGVVALVALGVLLRNLREQRQRITVSYGPGHDVQVPRGMTLLEISQMSGRPHMAVCGGRARCTTCRVRVLDGSHHLPEPGPAEAHTLAKLGAPPGLRLACQACPRGDVTVQVLLEPKVSQAAGPGRPAMHPAEFGEERFVTVLFADVRGSTRLAENRLPYDVVFLMNELLAQMAAAIAGAKGHYSNFTGDGLMALFGLEDKGNGGGARAALVCALDMLARLDRYNAQFESELDEPIRMGFGIHSGEAVVGWMGPPKTPVLTALGDTVNTAARLEGLTKELNAPIIASGATLEAAAKAGATALAKVRTQDVCLRGRTTTLPVAALDTAVLKAALG
jgi:adenylate cyclase